MLGSRSPISRGVVVAIILLVVLAVSSAVSVTAQRLADGQAPRFTVDPFWPKPLPNRWLLGQVAGVAVDALDHVWIVQRPRSLTDDEKGATLTPPRNEFCVPAPAVIEFDHEGNLLQAWGGPRPGYDWPTNEHGIFVDPSGNVWLAGNGEKDNQILKFARDGRFLMQIGKPASSGGDTDTGNLNRPRRCAGGRARQRGVRGRRLRQPPGDCLRRDHRRLQAPLGRQRPAAGRRGREAVPQSGPLRADRERRARLRVRPDEQPDPGVQEGRRLRWRVHPGPGDGGQRLGVDLDFSRDPAQSYLYVADGENNHVWTLSRATGKVLSRFARSGRYAGQLHWVHNMAVDSRGNIYTAEVDNAKRVQKFAYQGLFPLSD